MMVASAIAQIREGMVRPVGFLSYGSHAVIGQVKEVKSQGDWLRINLTNGRTVIWRTNKKQSEKILAGV